MNSGSGQIVENLLQTVDLIIKQNLAVDPAKQFTPEESKEFLQSLISKSNSHQVHKEEDSEFNSESNVESSLELTSEQNTTLSKSPSSSTSKTQPESQTSATLPTESAKIVSGDLFSEISARGEMVEASLTKSPTQASSHSGFQYNSTSETKSSKSYSEVVLDQESASTSTSVSNVNNPESVNTPEFDDLHDDDQVH